MKRWPRICSWTRLVLAAVLLSFATGWTCAICQHVRHEVPAARASWPVDVPQDWPPPAQRVDAWGVGYHRIVIDSEQNAHRPVTSATLEVHEVGWPFRAMFAIVRREVSPASGESQRVTLGLPTRFGALLGETRIVLPLGIHPLPAAGNVVIFVALLMAVEVPIMSARRRRARCPKCNADLAGIAGPCPECGHPPS
ncbi:MAG: hypothetical protein ACF8R7_04885 [Phycisphaerales bacterium JB039]